MCCLPGALGESQSNGCHLAEMSESERFLGELHTLMRISQRISHDSDTNAAQIKSTDGVALSPKKES